MRRLRRGEEEENGEVNDRGFIPLPPLCPTRNEHEINSRNTGVLRRKGALQLPNLLSSSPQKESGGNSKLDDF